jgi:tetratricopeptide (TPR) repeat protein/tRNA A-37 threonylcarbamoyl transferase component Bud32
MSSEHAEADQTAPEITGVYMPHAAQASGPRPPAGDATDALGEATVAPELGVPSALRRDTTHEETVAPDMTGAYVPQVTNAAGNRVGPAAETGVAEATGAYDPRNMAALPASATSIARPKRSRTGSVPGKRIGRYVLETFHAKGGMGEIWVAEDTAIGRKVALKQIFGKRPEQRDRFLIEATVTGQLEHPGIVPVHEVGHSEEGNPFYVMKFVHGHTLKKAIAKYHANERPSDVPREVQQLRLLQNFVSLVQTVAYAHSRGVLHRDLKPENVMLGPYGETLLLDWGLAKLIGAREETRDAGTYVTVKHSSESTDTQAGSIMGSPSYMAPEVAAGLMAEVDQRSDVYLLGATLYEILTGHLPREGTNLMRLIEQARRELPVAPRKLKRDVPRPLEAICMKALALRKQDRYATAEALAEDVQRYLAGEPVSAYRERLYERAWRWIKRHRRGLTFASAIAVVAGLSVLAVAKIGEAELRRKQAQEQTDRLRTLDQARIDAKTFRRLADDALFYAATADPASQHAPYFDPRQGEEAARAALAIVHNWGPALDQFPIDEEREPLKKEAYDLLLLLAQIQARQATGPDDAQALLDVLDQAAPLREWTQGLYRLRAQALRLRGEAADADTASKLAVNEDTPATAMDHFLLGDSYRAAASKQTHWQTEANLWQPDPELLRKAIEEFRLALRIDPNHFWSHLQLGRCYQTLGQGAEAVATLGACIALKPDSPWGYTTRAMALIYLQRFPEAEWNLNKALQLTPDNRVARLHRGVAYWRQGKRDYALQDFTEVLQPPTEQRLPEAAFYRGQLFLQEGDDDRALEDFNLVAVERPHFRTVYHYRCQIYFARGEDARGLDDLSAYLAHDRALDPRSAEAYEQRGHLLRFLDMAKGLRRKKAQLAVTELEHAVQMGSKSPSVFDDLGATLEQCGRVQDAVSAYTRGLELAPDDTLLLVKRGWALEQLNRLEDAEGDFAHAIRVSPKYAEAHTGLGYIRARRELKPDAQREADLAILHGADQYIILHNTACIYAVLSQSDKPRKTEHQDMAIALLQRAVELWRQAATGRSEIELIQKEAAFPQELRNRPEFQQLLNGVAAPIR